MRIFIDDAQKDVAKHFWKRIRIKTNPWEQSFKFQSNACNRYQDLLMSISLSNIAILNIKGSDYCCIICLICKTKAINLMQNIDLTEKSRRL